MTDFFYLYIFVSLNDENEITVILEADQKAQEYEKFDHPLRLESSSVVIYYLIESLLNYIL